MMILLNAGLIPMLIISLFLKSDSFDYQWMMIAFINSVITFFVSIFVKRVLVFESWEFLHYSFNILTGILLGLALVMCRFFPVVRRAFDVHSSQVFDQMPILIIFTAIGGVAYVISNILNIIFYLKYIKLSFND